jgi:DNA-binding CsgD family transcriptional regulator
MMSRCTPSPNGVELVGPQIVKSERRSDRTGPHRHRSAKYTALIVITGDCEVRSTFAGTDRSDGVTRFLGDDAKRLRPDIEIAVRAIISDIDAGVDDESIALLDGNCVMHLSPLIGTVNNKMYAVVIEADRNDDVIARAVARFHLTKRQIDVLLHVLDGANAAEVARALHLSEYTAQGYIKTLLVKTNSRNRAAMVAKVLNWRRGPQEPTSERDAPRRAAQG